MEELDLRILIITFMTGKKFIFYIVMGLGIKDIKANLKFIKTRNCILEAIIIQFKLYKTCNKKFNYSQKQNKLLYQDSLQGD